MKHVDPDGRKPKKGDAKGKTAEPDDRVENGDSGSVGNDGPIDIFSDHLDVVARYHPLHFSGFWGNDGLDQALAKIRDALGLRRGSAPRLDQHRPFETLDDPEALKHVKCAVGLTNEATAKGERREHGFYVGHRGDFSSIFVAPNGEVLNMGSRFRQSWSFHVHPTDPNPSREDYYNGVPKLIATPDGVVFVPGNREGSDGKQDSKSWSELGLSPGDFSQADCDGLARDSASGS